MGTTHLIMVGEHSSLNQLKTNSNSFNTRTLKKIRTQLLNSIGHTIIEFIQNKNTSKNIIRIILDIFNLILYNSILYKLY